MGRRAVMEDFIDEVTRYLAKAGPAADSTLYTRKFIQERLAVFGTPEHPTYCLMIQQAIAKLAEQGGSSEESISKCIASEYESLPWGHAPLLSHHLRKLRDRGEIVCVRDDRYMLPATDGMGYAPPVSSEEKFKSGHGTKGAENTELMRETQPEPCNVEAELRINRRSTEEVETDIGRGEKCPMEMEIDLQRTEFATEEINQVKENGQEMGYPAAEKICDERVVEPVQESEEQCATAERMPMLQELRVADPDKSDEHQMRLHNVISAPQDQAVAHPVIVEGTEEKLADSESRSKIMEEPPKQIQADDLSMRCDSIENQTNGQGEESESSEQIFQQICMLQEQMVRLVERLKQRKGAPGNGILLREKLEKAAWRNRRIGLDFQEVLKAFPEPSSSLCNETLRDGAAGARFSLHWHQERTGTAELSSSPPVPGCSENILKQQQPRHWLEQRQGSVSHAVSSQGSILGLHGGMNEVLPYVPREARAFPDESAFYNERDDNTIAFATNWGSHPASTSSNALVSNNSWAYREKLRSAKLSANPTPENPRLEEVKYTMPPPSIRFSLGMQSPTAAALTRDNSWLAPPVVKRSRGRPPKIA